MRSCHAFLASFHPAKKKYAVHLIRFGGSPGNLVYGIILMEELNPNIDSVFDGTKKNAVLEAMQLLLRIGGE